MKKCLEKRSYTKTECNLRMTLNVKALLLEWIKQVSWVSLLKVKR